MISFILLTSFVIVILYHLNIDLLRKTYIENQIQHFIQNTKENHSNILLLSYIDTFLWVLIYPYNGLLQISDSFYITNSWHPIVVSKNISRKQKRKTLCIYKKLNWLWKLWDEYRYILFIACNYLSWYGILRALVIRNNV